MIASTNPVVKKKMHPGEKFQAQKKGPGNPGSLETSTYRR